MEKKVRVLFLSTGNSTRSQMAEGFLRNLAGDRFDVVSAGIEPGTLHPLAVGVMGEAGIDISNQRPKNVAESLKDHFGYVITVCDMARERAPIFPFTPHLLHWNLKDPGLMEGAESERVEGFRRIRDSIRVKVQEFLAEVGVEKKKSEHAMAVSV